MHRIRIQTPKQCAEPYHYLDILHDALVNAWVAAGASPESVVGFDAKPWHFGALGWRGRDCNFVHTLVVGSPDPDLAEILKQVRTEEIRHVRALTGEAVDFSKASVEDDPAPIAPGQNQMGALMLSPLAVSAPKAQRNGRKWLTDLSGFPVGEAISARLSRLAGRPVQIRAWPDSLYLRTHPKHHVLVRTRRDKNGRESFVIGMKSPLVLEGSSRDLELAWCAGLGEKNRMGFGCIGTAERGVGR